LYSSRQRVPHGELLEYAHLGFGSFYEKELYLRLQNGHLITEKEIKKPDEEFVH